MGNAASQLHPTYINIYKKIIQIQAPQTRLQMIETCLSGPEYVSAAKMAGIYGQLLAYINHVRNGLQPPILPGETGMQDKSRASWLTAFTTESIYASAKQSNINV